MTEIDLKNKLSFSIKEFCALTGISLTKLYHEVKHGRLKALKAGRKTLIRRQDAEAWLGAFSDSPYNFEPLEASKSEEIDSHKIKTADLSKAIFDKPLPSEDEIVRKAWQNSEQNLCGIYFLVQGESVVYVGQSRNVYSRIAQHKTGVKYFDCWCYIKCAEKDLDAMESLYIHILRPKLNGKIKNSDQLVAPISVHSILTRLNDESSQRCAALDHLGEAG